jgi:hypothetical protein
MMLRRTTQNAVVAFPRDRHKGGKKAATHQPTNLVAFVIERFVENKGENLTMEDFFATLLKIRATSTSTA